jgi:2-amino-4-hydroxy-6-hydroxymethyldihydropteridine diphosphokinase
MKETPPERFRAGDASRADPTPDRSRLEMQGIYFSLGSNLGDRQAHLTAGIAGLRQQGMRTIRCSPVYRTEPVGGPPQPDFLNVVIEAEAGLAPREALEAIRTVEQERGRQPGGARWGPRPLDIDLLLFRDQVIDETDLQVPHPRFHLRRFVLVPLADLAPDLTPPQQALSVRGLLDECADRAAVRLHAPPLPVSPEAVRGA